MINPLKSLKTKINNKAKKLAKESFKRAEKKIKKIKVVDKKTNKKSK